MKAHVTEKVSVPMKGTFKELSEPSGTVQVKVPSYLSLTPNVTVKPHVTEKVPVPVKVLSYINLTPNVPVKAHIREN